MNIGVGAVRQHRSLGTSSLIRDIIFHKNVITLLVVSTNDIRQ